MVLISLVGLGYVVGTYFENRHYHSISQREEKYRHISVVTNQWKGHIESDDEGLIMNSGTVVASDYFKTLVSGLKSIFGGRLNAYETLLERGRREAVLRVLEQADQWGAYKLVNLRIETSTISSLSQSKGSLPCVELFAYATALRKKGSMWTS